MDVQAHLSVRAKNGSASIADIPLGEYCSEYGDIEVTERITHIDYGTYFIIKMHNPPFPPEKQEPNEFLQVHVYPNKVVLAI